MATWSVARIFTNSTYCIRHFRLRSAVGAFCRTPAQIRLCARHSPNKFGSALACAKIREISATDKVAILPVERD